MPGVPGPGEAVRGIVGAGGYVARSALARSGVSAFLGGYPGETPSFVSVAGTGPD